jgi:hypothetical protein
VISLPLASPTTTVRVKQRVNKGITVEEEATESIKPSGSTDQNAKKKQVVRLGRVIHSTRLEHPTVRLIKGKRHTKRAAKRADTSRSKVIKVRDL